MPYGAVLFSWDSKLGSVLDTKHPMNLEVSEELINKIYMTFAYSKNFEKEEIIETSYNNFILLSYCDKTRVPKVGYEIITLFLEEREKIETIKLKSQLMDLGKEVFETEKELRNKFFIEKIKSIFGPNNKRKILLLGRAGTGKSTIKKIVFEGADPKELLYNPLEPTRGVNPTVYSWLDIDLGLFDSSGQELSFLLDNEDDQEHILAFENNDCILYIFDYTNWLEKQDHILRDISKIRQIIRKNSYPTDLILFFHKIDLCLEKSLSDVETKLQNRFNLPIYFTSIHPKYIYNLYNAFYEILSEKSIENSNIKKILEKELNNSSKTMYFITDLNDSIIIQSMTNDFNTLLINYFHNLVSQIIKTFELMTDKDKINHVIISSDNNLNIILNNIKFTSFGLKNLICVSESLSANKLIWIVGQIKQKLREHLHFNKEV